MPRGKAGGVIVSAASTVIESVPDTTLSPSESVTFAVKLNVPGVALAEIVPPIAPELVRLSPPGKAPELTTQVNGPTPPPCVSVAAYTALTSPVGRVTGDVMVS